MGITGLPFGQGGGVLCGWEADNSRGLTLRGVEVGRRPTTQWRRPTAMFYKAPPGEALGAPWDSLASGKGSVIDGTFPGVIASVSSALWRGFAIRRNTGDLED